ncbi:hypothetical protein QTP88_017734 [Uroleucon formosanum]
MVADGIYKLQNIRVHKRHLTLLVKTIDLLTRYSLKPLKAYESPIDISINNSYEECPITSKRYQILKNYFKILKRKMNNRNKKATGQRYNNEFKKIALTLNYYSPKTYKYCRILKLPHPAAIQSWTLSVNGEPRFFSEVFQALKILSPEEKQWNLLFDAMSIKKQVIWDKKTHKFVGYCDFGGQVSVENSETTATEVLVFMLASLNGK